MFAPTRLLARWARKGLLGAPDSSRYQDGITRRVLLSMSTATLLAAQAGKVEAAALWLGKTQIPVVLAPLSWNGTATAQTDTEDPTTLGDGSWNEQPVAGFDCSDYYPFDPPSYSGNAFSNVVTALVSHADPSGQQYAYVGVSLNDGPEVPLPVRAMSLNPRTRAFGFPFAVASLLPVKGNIKLKLRVRPVNGREKVHTKIIFLDHFNIRDVRYIAPSGSNANDGLTAATAWRDRAWAEANAPQGSRVIVAAGDYRNADDSVLTGVVPGASSTTTIKANVTNEQPILLDAAPGVAMDSIIFGVAPQSSGYRTGQYSWYSMRVRHRGVSTDWSNFKTLRVAGTVGSVKPALAWERFHNWESSATAPKPLGPTVDPTNGNIVDPDEAAQAGTGGFGFYYDGTTNYPDPSQVFYGSDGCWYSMENGANQIISLRGASTSLHFELGCTGIHGFDAVYIGSSSVRGLLNPDGSPKNDSDDFAIINTVHNFPGKTPFKQRLHTTPTVRVKAATLLVGASGTAAQRTLTWQVYNASTGAYTTNTYASGVGFMKLTFDNQVDGTPPYFNPRYSLSTDNTCRFMSGALAGQFSPAQGATGNDQDTYGWRLLLLGTQNGNTPTLNGVQVSLASNECIVCGDFTLPGFVLNPGDMLTLFNKQHTDCFQTGQVAVGAANYNNWMVQTYTAKGPGFGNMVLYQPAGSLNVQNGTADVSAAGIMSNVAVQTPSGTASTASTAFPLRVGDCVMCTDTSSYASQRYQVAFVDKVNGDGTYKLSRPFVTSDGKTAIAASGMSVQVTKSVLNSAFLNVMIACPNTGQLGGGLRNNQFLSCTFISYTGGGTTPTSVMLMRLVQFGGGIHALTIRDTLMMCPSGTSCVSIPNWADPRRDGYITNCGMNKAGGYPASWSANDNATLTSLPSLAIDINTFEVTAGMTRTVGGVVVPFDSSGVVRSSGRALLGALAA